MSEQANLLQRAAGILRQRDMTTPGFSDAVADLLDELARQFDAPPCDGAPNLCNNCERRDDFRDALWIAEVVLAAGVPA